MNQIDVNKVIKHLLDENKEKSYEIAILKTQLELVKDQLLKEVKKDDGDEVEE